MTYGEHRRRAFAALGWLLASSAQGDEQERAEMLAYRGATLAATYSLADRSVHGADPLLRIFPPPTRRIDLGRVVTSAPSVLVGEIGRYPRLTPEATSLMEAFDRPSHSPSLRAWAEAARHWTVATETLLERTEWTREPNQAWSVLADVADVAESIALLDRDVIPWANPRVSATVEFWRSNDQLRLMSRYVGALALSGEGDDAIAHLRRQGRRSGVVTVGRLQDLRPAGERLVDLVEQSSFSAQQLRAFALAQADLARRCQGIVGETDLGLSTSLGARFDAYRSLAASTARIGSINVAEGAVPIAQLSEIALGLTRAHHRRATGLVDQLLMHEPYQAAVGRALGRSISRAVANGSYLVLDDAKTEVAWRRVGPGELPSMLSASSELTRAASADLGFAAERLRVVRGPAVEHGEAETARPTFLRARLNASALRRPTAPNRTLGA